MPLGFPLKQAETIDGLFSCPHKALKPHLHGSLIDMDIEERSHLTKPLLCLKGYFCHYYLNLNLNRNKISIFSSKPFYLLTTHASIQTENVFRCRSFPTKGPLISLVNLFWLIRSIRPNYHNILFYIFITATSFVPHRSRITVFFTVHITLQYFWRPHFYCILLFFPTLPNTYFQGIVWQGQY